METNDWQLDKDAGADKCDNPGQSRSVDVQPIFFQSSASDPKPTGATWPGRIATSNTVWGKLGVTFNALTPITLTDATNKTAGNNVAEWTRIIRLWSGTAFGVFFVDNDVAAGGGGATNGGGAAGARTVLSDRGTSTTLLAHELGHSLGLLHPPGGADANTVMTPSSSNNANNPTRNTMGNYSRISYPAGSGSICLHPDA